MIDARLETNSPMDGARQNRQSNQLSLQSQRFFIILQFNFSIRQNNFLAQLNLAHASDVNAEYIPILSKYADIKIKNLIES